jgi:molecular chaperone GrpE
MSDTKQDVTDEMSDPDQEYLAATDNDFDENVNSSNSGDNSDKNTNEAKDHHDPEKMLLLLEDARNKADEHWDQCLRLNADIENLRRRHERELEKAHKFALENFAKELLPVTDSLELGLNAASEDNADASKTLKEGSELTLKMLKTALEKFGLREINPVGEPFNPEWHQAMSMQESDKVSPNTVITVFQKGYQLNERLIRPAMVVVAKAVDGASGSGGPGSGDMESDPDDTIDTQFDEKA